MSESDPIELVRRLNSLLDEVDFVTLRDSIEALSTLEELRASELGWLARRFEALVAPDIKVEWVGATTAMVEGSEWESREDWLRLWRDWLTAWDDYSLEHGRYALFGDQVVVGAVHRGRGRGSGLEAEITQGQLWTVKDGRVARCRIYETREDAERAAREELEAPSR